MAYIHPKDRVLEHSTTAGTGPYALSGAIDTSFNAFSASMSVGDTTIGTIVEPGVAFWSGVLTYSAAGQITRTGTAFESKGTFGAGTKEIFMGGPASRTPLRDSNNTFDGLQTFTNATEATGVGTTAAALFAGGVEIAKKLFVVGAVALSSTLAVAGNTTFGVGSATNAVTTITKTGGSLTGGGVVDNWARNGAVKWQIGFGSAITSQANDSFQFYRVGSGTVAITLNTDDTISIGSAVTVSQTLSATGLIYTASSLTAVGNLTIGPGGAGGDVALINVQGGSASLGGSIHRLYKGGTLNWQIGHYGAIHGTTSSDLEIYNQSFGITVVFGATDNATSIRGALNVVGATTLTAALTASANANYFGSGAAATNSRLFLQGGTGAGGGGHINIQKGGAQYWYIGQLSSIFGSGTSDDFSIYSQSYGNSINVNYTSGQVTIGSAVQASSSITGALVVGGGIGALNLYLGTGANTVGIHLDGGTASSGGGLVYFKKAATAKWYFGQSSTILGNTSDDLMFYTTGFGTSMILSWANGQVSIYNTSSVPVNGVTGGALYVAGGIGASGTCTFNNLVFLNSAQTVYIAREDAVTAGSNNKMYMIATGGYRMYGLSGTPTMDTNGNFTNTSDERLKVIHGNFTRGRNDLKKIIPILHSWNKESGYETESTYAGFSAQNVQSSIPEAIGENLSGFLTFNDRPILAALVNAVNEIDKDHTDEITRLKARVQELETRLAA